MINLKSQRTASQTSLLGMIHARSICLLTNAKLKWNFDAARSVATCVARPIQLQGSVTRVKMGPCKAVCKYEMAMLLAIKSEFDDLG